MEQCEQLAHSHLGVQVFPVSVCEHRYCLLFVYPCIDCFAQLGGPVFSLAWSSRKGQLIAGQRNCIRVMSQAGKSCVCVCVVYVCACVCMCVYVCVYVCACVCVCTCVCVVCVVCIAWACCVAW